MPEGPLELRPDLVDISSGIYGVQLPFLLPKPRASEAWGIRAGTVGEVLGCTGLC